MSGIVVELEASEHQKVEKMLPWLLADALSESELGLLRTHLAECRQCQADLAWQRELLHVGEPPPFAETDVERAFQAFGRRLEDSRAPPWSWPRRRPPGLAAALALQTILVALFAVALGHASGEVADEARRLRVSFRPATPETELRRILLAHGARIVDGPSASGAYLLQLPDRDAALHTLRRESAVLHAELPDGSAPGSAQRSVAR